MKNLSSCNFEGKRVLLRSDLNSDVVSGKVLESERIKASAGTIAELKRKRACVVVIAHQGNPGKSDFVSLKQHSKFLNKYVKIKFVDDVVGSRAVNEIKKLKNGEALLLENIRFVRDEFKPWKGKRNKLIKNLSGLFDFYINDAFSVCHRAHTSIVGFPKYLKNCAGRLLEGEVGALRKMKLGKCLFILGGAKPEDNLKLLGKNKVLACGLFGQMCVIARGKDLGAQNKYLRKEIKNYDKEIKELKKKLSDRVITPIDFAVNVNGSRRELSLNEFPSKYEIFDIGSETQKKFIAEIKKAKSVFMKGPAGYCADKKFCKGSFKILNAIAKNRGFSIIGGGHLSDAVKKSGISQKKFGYVSLSGGALLNYVAGEKLVGLRVLK